MQVSMSAGGSPAAVQGAVDAAIKGAAGENASAQSLGSAVSSYVSRELSGVPTGQTAAVQVHVHITVVNPAPTAGTDPAEAVAAAAAAAK